MSSTANSTSAVHRFKQVYVDIPPSPLHSSHKDPRTFHKTPLSTSAQLKENTPLRRSNASISPMEPLSHKRKLSGASASSPEVVRAMPTVKKQKLVTATGSSAKSKPGQSSGVQETNSEYPSGFFYCHQCSKKRDALGISSRFRLRFNTSQATRCIQSVSSARSRRLSQPGKVRLRRKSAVELGSASLVSRTAMARTSKKSRLPPSTTSNKRGM